jgi:CheY-like chemotaxis protein
MRRKTGRLALRLHDVDLNDRDAARHGLAAGAYVELIVCDTGSGMNNDVQKRIFEPYFTTKGVGEGSGLGLSVVKGIVTQLGGAIAVKSSVGVGTCFTVYLSAMPSSVVPRVVQNVACPVGDETVLLLDDDALVANTCAAILEHLGYKVDTYTDPEHALESFIREPQRYGAVITDMTMPGQTGIDVARRIFSIRSNMPMILLSGYADTLDLEAARDAGFRAFVAKPFSSERLAVALREALDLPEQRIGAS